MGAKPNLTIQYVTEFIKNNSQCILVSKTIKVSRTKLDMICGCGNLFTVTFNAFAQQNKRQCNVCGREIGDKQRRSNLLSAVEYIESNTTLKYVSGDYKSNTSKLILRCGCGELMERSLTSIQSTVNANKISCCIPCDIKARALKQTHPMEIILDYIENETDCSYVSGEYKHYKSKLVFRCKCGKEFKTTWDSFKSSGKQTCNTCSKQQSKAERKIELYLCENNIEFISEYRFDDCRYKNTLPFDFYIPELNLCMEYDGEFHYRDTKIHNVVLQQARDTIKDSYCLEKGIRLVRIPYYELKNLNTILNTIFKYGNTEVSENIIRHRRE